MRDTPENILDNPLVFLARVQKVPAIGSGCLVR
jgi:hypothetical protein